MPAPSKVTNEMLDQMIDMRKTGMSDVKIAAAMGISPSCCTRNLGSRVKKALRCLACDEPCEHRRRGRCPSCYQLAANRVEQGHTTWEYLESKGFAEPVKGNPFYAKV